jgi:hypothetical protein
LLSDNSKKNEFHSTPTFKIYPVIRHLKNRFKNLYLPNPNIAIDEFMTLWKGCVSFLQYILLKAAKFGISHSISLGYVSCFLIYTVHSTEMTNWYVNADTNKTSATVIKLVEYHLDHGHSLDGQFYSCPELAQFLKSKDTFMYQQEKCPPFIKDKRPMKGNHSSQQVYIGCWST